MNIREDAWYFHGLKSEFELGKFYSVLSQAVGNFYHSITDDEEDGYVLILNQLNVFALQ